MKVDSYTASAVVQTLDKIKKPDTKSRLEFIINKGNKAQFLKTIDVAFGKTVFKQDLIMKTFKKFNDFSREEFIVEDNVAILRKIVKDKRNMPIKLKDGQMKVDLYTASAFVQTLDKIKKPDSKK